MTLTRASRYPTLQSRAQFMGKLQYSSSTVPSSDGTRGDSSLLRQKFYEMNISTSVVSSDDSVEGVDVKRSGVHWAVEPSVDRSVRFPMRSCVKSSVSSVMETCKDDRQFVLERVGLMLDGALLSESETKEAIGLAMKADGTYMAMKSLMCSRSTLKSQSMFLKLWLQTVLPHQPSPSPINRLLKPKAVYHRGLSEETTCGDEGISHSISFHRPSFPSTSPPLVPIALQFDRSSDDTPPLVFAPVR